MKTDKPPQHTKKQFFVIAHNIRSLHNVGSIFRTAESLGVSKLYLTGYTGKPPDPKIAKVALGAEQLLPWEYKRSVAALIKTLRKTYPNISIIGLENNVKSNKLVSLNKLKPKFPAVLLLGHETTGIPKSLFKYCDTLVEIPMQGQKESLNVSVAFGIAAYVLLNK
jgi:tRNA G18 (ribose-2'-O)-methylase SpoU